MKYLTLVYSLSLISLAWFLDFPVVANDFIGLITLSKYIDFADLSTYYNGIYPVGYLLLLKLGNHYHIPIAIYGFVINIISSTTLLFVLKKAFDSKYKIGAFCLFVVLFSFIDSIYFKYLVTPGAYMLFISLLLTGLLTSNYADKTNNNKWLLVSIITFGLASHVRFHGIGFIVIFICVSIIISRNYKNTLNLIVGLIPFAISHLLVNYYGTGELFNSHHNLMVESVNWIEIDPSYQFEQMSYENFIELYLENIKTNSIYLLPFVYYILIKKDKKELLIISWTCLIYYFTISLHPSERGILPVIPMSYYILFHSINIQPVFNILRNRTPFQQTSFVLISLFIAILFIRNSQKPFFERVITNHQQSIAIEEVMIKQEVDDPKIIFTNSYDLYFPHYLPEILYTNGGWEKLNHTTYKHFENVNLNSEVEFVNDLKHKNIDYLILDTAALHNQFKTIAKKETILNTLKSNKVKVIPYSHDEFLIYKLL